MGFESVASCLLDRHSNQLCYSARHLINAYFIVYQFNFKKVISGNTNTPQYDNVIYTLIFLYLQVNLNESLNGV